MAQRLVGGAFGIGAAVGTVVGTVVGAPFGPLGLFVGSVLGGAVGGALAVGSTAQSKFAIVWLYNQHICLTSDHILPSVGTFLCSFCTSTCSNVSFIDLSVV